MGRVTVLGVFVADLAFEAPRLPVMGETVLGSHFRLGPGGKGSNQAIAARRAGAEVALITRLGDDEFGRLARRTYAEEGIGTDFVSTSHQGGYTGAAFILVQHGTGENAIVVAAGAVEELAVADIDAATDAIARAEVFATNLELPVALARRGLEIARAHGVRTILNPAPFRPIPDDIYPLCDFVTPNETEAAALTGLAVDDMAGAEAAARWFAARGVALPLVTLGAKGALLLQGGRTVHVPAVAAGPVIDTTGAGDAFNGGFAVALAEGRPPAEAARFGCTVAGLSVTRKGTAPSMPTRAEIDRLL